MPWANVLLDNLKMNDYVLQISHMCFPNSVLIKLCRSAEL